MAKAAAVRSHSRTSTSSGGLLLSHHTDLGVGSLCVCRISKIPRNGEKIVAKVETLPRTICRHTTPSWPSVYAAVSVICAAYEMKIYSSVFLSPGNPWWVVESHTRSVLPGIMRPVRRAAMSWSQYVRPTKESRVGPVGILKMFAMTPRRSWKHELEWQEKPETWHTRTWCGAEQGTRSLISGWGWRRSLARWEPKGRAAALGEQGRKCQFPAVGTPEC